MLILNGFALVDGLGGERPLFWCSVRPSAVIRVQPRVLFASNAYAAPFKFAHRHLPMGELTAHFFMQSIMNFQRASRRRFFSFACVKQASCFAGSLTASSLSCLA